MIDRFKQSSQRLASVFRRAQLDRELDVELAAHLEMAIEENLQRGMSAEEARRQALIDLGGTEQARQRHREARGLAGLDRLLQDLIGSIALVLVAILAAYIPARRASSIDPMRALHSS